MTYYCPVCYKEIPETVYGKTYIGCIPMYNLDKETGLTSTCKGTIRLGKFPGEFYSVYPKEIFNDWFDELRDLQKKGSVRVGRCI